jgi:hypothetical protein
MSGGQGTESGGKIHRQGRLSKASVEGESAIASTFHSRADLSEKGPCLEFRWGVEGVLLGRDAFPRRPQ